MSASIKRRIRNTVVPFKFTPFSKKQLQILTWWNGNSPFNDFDAIIADGAIRSGKTVSLALSFTLWAMDSFNGESFGICGKTIHSCRRNVIAPLKKMLASRNMEVIEVRNENLIIIVQNVLNEHGLPEEIINYFYIFGGKDESSQDLIQGITLAGVFFDEVALMPQSFVNQATGRNSVKGSKFWFSCNPSSPFHWFKKEWIDKGKAKRVLYLHFTMHDNPSLDADIIKRYESLYTGVFYKRYILGLWVAADGVVFSMFDEEKHVKVLHKNWTRTFIAGDFGINNPTTFGLYGYYAPEHRYHLIKTYYHNGRESMIHKTTKMYADDLMNFIKANAFQPEYIIMDPSASAMIVELQKHSWFIRNKIETLPALNDVMLGIQFESYLLTEELFTVDPSCIEDIEEFGSYVWDNKQADKKGEDIVMKEHDHCMDRNRYAVITDSVLNDIFTYQIENYKGNRAA